MNEITPRQAKILAYLKNYIVDNGVPPSLADIARHFKCSRTNANYHLSRLEDRGFVKRMPSIARGIKVLEL